MNEEKTKTQKHFYEANYWKEEGKSVLDLRRMITIYTLISVENNPAPNFISPVGTEGYEGWWFSWEDRSPHSLMVETDGSSISIYAFKNSEFEFYHDLYFPDSDPEKRDPASKEFAMERLQDAIADAKKWLQEHAERLREPEAGKDRNQQILDNLFWWGS